ncbi:DUF1643 domain-containing protein [Carnobacterium maltaromaticum]|uniref:DUF1643 domain-containing protein n=1 Tax=Carnobacterium maltaromaticum TaxID=2751 RepID=UPI00191BAB2E|nr:DUF1643 domain-containing protein [Carnobacterium maltaromaticum]CAD5898181.1 hypothetical protein CMALT394_200068 [Carnobacterium maltaromaticum]
MEHKYTNYVKKDKIDICIKKMKGFEFRTYLKIPLINKSEKKMIIIMMNPSKANKDDSDITVNKVLEYANKNELYNEVIILNVISLYESSSNKIKKVRNDFIQCHSKEKFEELMKINFNKIKSTVEN